MTEQLQLRRGTASQVAAFTGAQGEVVVDTTNNRAVINDGSTAGGWPAARLAEVVTNTRTAVSDAPYSALASDRNVAYTALTASRVVTLPASSAFPTGTPLTVFDESGACSATKTITLSPTGSDLIDGAASAVVCVPYGYIALQTNAAGKWTIIDSAIVTPASAAAGHVATFGATPGTFVDGGTSVRKLLTSAATYYVRAVVGNPTISNASPALASLTAHGLQANDPIVFSILPFQSAVTVTQANPAVVTWTAHGFSAGQPVVFASTGDLPYGIVAGTTYYVLAAGLTTNAFEISATVGGSAISTAAPTLTFTNGSANISLATASTYLVVGQQVQFANSGGALPTNFAAATTYFVLSVSSTTITVSATNGGAAISAGSAGSGTQTLSQVGTHYGSATGALPTGVIAGTVYYVLSTGLTANAFEFSASLGGAAINTSSAQAGTISLATGNDANNGLAQNRAGALLMIQAAYYLITNALDLGGQTATIQLADGLYASGSSSALVATGAPIGGGAITLKGNTSYPPNVLLSTTSVQVIQAVAGAVLNIEGFALASSGSHGLYAFNGSSIYVIGVIAFGTVFYSHCTAISHSLINISSGYFVYGGAQFHWDSEIGSMIYCQANALTLLGVPALSIAFAYAAFGAMYVNADTFSGSVTGSRYDATANGVLQTFGSGASYLPGNTAGSASTGGQYI